MKRKEIWTHGYIRYNILKKMIKFITKLKNNYEIRKVFLYLVEEGIFLKQKTKVKSYLYKFKNDNEITVNDKAITISFN